MRILVFGAGVIGSIYGAKLAGAGHDVTLLARGPRKAALEAGGLQLTDALTGAEQVLRLPVSERAEGAFDLVLITLREAQLDSALPQLRALPPGTAILFMLNCPLKVGPLTEALGPERAFFAFPGAGGVHEGARIRYTLVRQQPTSFGPVRGQPADRSRALADLFAAAGLAVDLVPDMEAWLLTHAVLITALCGALYGQGGVSKALARSPAALNDMIAGLRDGLAVVAALGFTPSPGKLRLLARLPRFVTRRMLARLLASDFAEFAIDGHANAAPEDMRDLAADCRRMVGTSGIAAPALLRLCDAVDSFAARGGAKRQ